MTRLHLALAGLLAVLFAAVQPAAAQTAIEQQANTWVKRSPLKTAPPSPAMGYEASLAYDPVAKRIIRWAGHNQGGGGEQNAETWTFDPVTATWELKEPNLSPPGVCCAQQNVFDVVGGRFLRFQGFSGNHGWQWFREIYLNNSAVWSYDLAKNTWRDMRVVPAPRLGPLRCASWDSDREVVVLFGGEGSNEGTLVFDPYTNTFTRMSPKVQPAFRSAGNMAYDSRRKRHVLFGSQFSDDPHTWAYDLAKNEWIDLKPTVQPPTDRNDAVLAYDEHSGMVIASVRAIDALGGKENKDIAKGRYETWAYDGAANTWKKMNPPEEPPGDGNRRRIMVAVPDQNVIVMENFFTPSKAYPGEREQQMWTYRFGAAKAPLPAKSRKAREQPRVVEDVAATVENARRVVVRWPAPPADESLRYHVERAVVEVYSEDEIARLRKDTPPLAEPSVGAIKAIGAFVKITKTPLTVTEFADESIDLAKSIGIEGKPIHVRTLRKDQLHEDGKPYRFAVYAYRVRALNERGVESGPGPYVLTIPSSPQWLFSKEDGTTCHLKWAANPEKGVTGYRVFRMESPRINGPGQPVTRLTPEPIAEPRFVDTGAGKATRRYWVVAVDALGQEGFPSAPTWHQRQYRSYYLPFTGEWHQ
jgi:hypothetical protein